MLVDLDDDLGGLFTVNFGVLVFVDCSESFVVVLIAANATGCCELGHEGVGVFVLQVRDSRDDQFSACVVLSGFVPQVCRVW